MPRVSRGGIAAMVAVVLVTSGCYGPFNLTRRLYQWNGQVGGKWENEFIFLLFVWLPVYGVTTLADAVVFNSIEFWGGQNPVNPPGMSNRVLPTTKRLVRGDAEAVLTYTSTPKGPELLVQQFRSGAPAGSLHIQRRDGVTVGSDAQGTVLLTATSLQDGGVIVTDAQGKRVASYSADQVDRVLGASYPKR